MLFCLFVLTALAINPFTCPSSTFCENHENQRKGKKFEEGPFPPEVAGLPEGAQQRLTSSARSPSARPAHLLGHVALAPTAPWLAADRQGTCTRPVRAPENHGGPKPARPSEIPQKHPHRGPCSCHLGNPCVTSTVQSILSASTHVNTQQDPGQP